MNSTTPNDPDDSLFTERLRVLYDAAGEEAQAPAPAPGAWAGVAARLQPAASRPGRTLAAGLFGVVTGVLLMGWWNPAPTSSADRSASDHREVRVTAASSPMTLSVAPAATGGETPADARNAQGSGVRATAAEAARADGPTAGSIPSILTAMPERAPGFANNVTNNVTSNVAETALNLPASPEVAAPVVPAQPATSTHVLSANPIAVVLLPLIQAETAYAGLAPDSLREPRRAALRRERVALAALTRRTDSLLLALGEPAAGLAAPAVAVAPDSAPAPVWRRWSVLLAGTPERSLLGLQAPGLDTLSSLHRSEQGRAGLNAAVLAEYRLSPRWSVAVGGGLSTTGAELRLTDRRTVVGVVYDTTTATSSRTDAVTRRAYTIQIVDEPHATPRYNLSGQVIGFDTIWVQRPDTVWTVSISTLLTTNTTRTVTPVVSRHDEVSARVLRPTYRFLTVPLLVRYRLGRATDWTSSPTAPRWWADVAVGAQLQFFLGGTQLVSADGGRTFHSERVGRHQSAFRPLNVAVLGQVAVNYALTPRLSASLAPTVRWQAQSVYRSAPALTQRPTAAGVQVGVRYSF